MIIQVTTPINWIMIKPEKTNIGKKINCTWKKTGSLPKMFQPTLDSWKVFWFKYANWNFPLLSGIESWNFPFHYHVTKTGKKFLKFLVPFWLTPFGMKIWNVLNNENPAQVYTYTQCQALSKIQPQHSVAF